MLIRFLIVIAVVSLPVWSCTAGDAVFSRDGERIYAIKENKPILREITLADETERQISLPQLRDRVAGLARSDDDRVFCLTETALWLVNLTTGAGEKIITAPENSRFWRVAYSSKLRAAFVTSDRDSLIMVKSKDEVSTVFVRRHDRVSCPVFAADGAMFWCEGGDLWQGKIESEEGRLWLAGERYAPLAYLETDEGTPSEMGVSDIAVTRDSLYVQLFRMGGSGSGLMLQVPRLPPEETQVSGMAQVGELKLRDYRRILEGFKPLGENDHEATLCASPDETKVFYVRDRKEFLVSGGETKELHLRVR
jgi:hypothetical protein